MKKYIELIRVKHWIKNILVFVPMITSKIINLDNIITCILGFLAFSFASSFIYIINDIKDFEKDKLHERKKLRPLTSGRIKKNTAIIIAIIMLVLSIVTSILAKHATITPSLLLVITYITLNIAYSFGLKNVAIVDLAILASGFVIRIYWGAALVNVAVSGWLLLTTLSIALYCGIGKRRKELIKSNDYRTVLKQYNEVYLNKFETIMLSLTLVFYSLWTIEQTNNYLIYTVPLVIIILMKYSLIVETSDEGDTTTILFSDKLLLSLCVLYSIVFTTLLLVFK